MEQKEKSAIDSCMVDICDTLKQAVVALVDHMSNLNLISDEERDLIEEIKTKEGKVAQVMRMLKAKDDSFDSLVAYFEKKGHKKLVAKLRDLAGKSSTANDNLPDKSSQISPIDLPIKELHKPTNDEIRVNERFYYVEKRVFEGVPETKGELNLPKIDYTDSLRIKSKFDDKSVYRNFSKPKGLALVINNRDFYGPKTNPLPNRLGTDVDATNSAKLWRNFGYEVNQVENLTGEQLLREMARFALDSRHAKSDSAVVVMLSHGGHGGIYGVDGELVEIDRLVMCLNALHCPALIDKPKLIIIQACRGEQLDMGHHTDQTDGSSRSNSISDENIQSLINLLNSSDETDSKSLKKRIPVEADILISYATTPGYVSWRNSMKGSWFIQSVCEIFSQYGHEKHLLDMLIMVNNRVSEVNSSSGCMQIPDFSTRLRKQFFIFPGVYE